MDPLDPEHRPAKDAPRLSKDEARRRALKARDSLGEEERERLAQAVRTRALELPETRRRRHGHALRLVPHRARHAAHRGPSARGRQEGVPAARRSGRGSWPPTRSPTWPPISCRASGTSRSRARCCPRCRRRTWTSCSFLARPSTSWAAAAATAAASTTATCRARDPALRGSRSPSRRSSWTDIDCEPHDLPVTAIVTERRVIRPGRDR